MNDSVTTLNPGSGGDSVDSSLVTQSNGTVQAKRQRVVLGGDAGQCPDGQTDLVQPIDADPGASPSALPVAPVALVDEALPGGYVTGDMRVLSMTSDGRLRVSASPPQIDVDFFGEAPDYFGCAEFAANAWSMADLQVIGTQQGSVGVPKPFTAGVTGAQRVSDAHGRYMEAVLAGRAYYLSVADAAPTAYVGAAGGTPLLAIHNPSNSNVMVAALMVVHAGKVSAATTGMSGLELWAGASVQPTGTKTTPTNAYSQVASGSAVLGFVNTALTSSTALNLALPLATYYWATAASAFFAGGQFDLAGLIFAPPGNEIALGLSTVPGSDTHDVAMYWEEIPLLTFK